MAYQVDCLTSPNLSCCGLLALGRTLQARAAVHVKHVEDQAVQVKAEKSIEEQEFKGKEKSLKRFWSKS